MNSTDYPEDHLERVPLPDEDPETVKETEYEPPVPVPIDLINNEKGI